MRTSTDFFTAKNSFLALSLFTGMIFAAGCGSGAGINGVPPGGGTGSYSNASLNGSYVYQLSGTVSSSPFPSYQEAGVFIADGNGHITGGIDDFTQGSTFSLGSTISGSYAIASNGTGTISLTSSTFTASLAVTLVSSAKAYLIEADPLNAAGVAELQSPSAIGAVPNGTFVFKTHTTAGAIPTSTVGQFTLQNGGIFQSGFVDVNRAGSFSSPALANFNFNPPISNGRGTGNYTENPGVTSGFNYYIVDSNNIRLLSTDTLSNSGGIGRAELQSAGSFSTSSLSGSYVFLSKGDDNFGLNTVNTVGVFAASGGNITSGAFDSVEDGTPFTNVALTGGTYQVASNGRVAASLISSAATVNQILWMVSPSRAFSITESDTSDSSLTQDGIDDLQQTTAFSNSSIKGQFALVMHGFNPTVLLDRIGTLQWDGNGNLILNELVNDTGVVSTPGTLTGTYSAAANGRVTGTINTVSANSNDLVFYMISNSSGNVLQEDAGTEISGTTELQH